MCARKVPLVNEEIYHIYSKSIAGFKIFRNRPEYQRMAKLFNYYRTSGSPLKFSAFLEIKNKDIFCQKHLAQKDKMVEIIAYCLMPTHIHLILKQKKTKGISLFMKNSLIGYTRYFNVKNKRKGPLWEGRFQNRLVDSDEYILHLTRYIHLNPVTSKLKNKPEDWKYSSYREYLNLDNNCCDKICKFSDYIDMDVASYKKFVEDNINYQRELNKIKHLIDF
jgi:putative transposase